MKKIRTVIVEDELQTRFFLKEELSRYKNLDIIDEYENGLEGLSGINDLKPDLVFVNGFKMLKKLQYDPAVIFCAGYSNYMECALKAWDYNVSDFIIKPVEPLRMKQALAKAFSDIENRRRIKKLSHQKRQGELEHISWVDKYGERISRFFSADDIIFIKSDADYIKFFLVREVLDELEINESFISVKMTIKKAVETLEKHGFRRAHRGYVANLDKIIYWNKSKMTLRLKGAKKPIPVGRVYMDNFTNIKSIQS